MMAASDASLFNLDVIVAVGASDDIDFSKPPADENSRSVDKCLWGHSNVIPADGATSFAVLRC